MWFSAPKAMIRQGSDEALSHAAIDLFRDDRRLVGRLRVVAFTDEEHDPTPSQVVATATRRPVVAHDDQIVLAQLPYGAPQLLNRLRKVTVAAIF